MGASIIEGTKAAPTCWGDVLILGLGKSGKAAASYCLNLLGGRVKSVTIAAGEKNDAALEFARRLARTWCLTCIPSKTPMTRAS